MAFAADDSAASTEIATLSFGGGSTNLVTYTYGVWPQTIADSNNIDESAGATDSGVYRFYLDADGASFTAQAGSIPPGSAYWTPSCADSEDLCYNSGSVGTGDYEYGVGFKRTTGGAAGIQCGSSVSGSILMTYNGAESLYQAGQMSWADCPEVEDDTDDDTTSDDTTADDTTDDTADDDTQDDGASVLTYGAALAASVYALAF